MQPRLVRIQKQVGNDQLQIINLSSKILSPSEAEVLTLGLSFFPASWADKFEVVKDVNLFARRLTYKYMYDKKRRKEKQELMEREQWKGFTVRFHGSQRSHGSPWMRLPWGALQRGVSRNPFWMSPLRHSPRWTILSFVKNPRSFPL